MSSTLIDRTVLSEYRSLLNRTLSWATLVLFLGACGGELRQNNFDSTQELRQSDLIDKGWVPEDLPDDLTDIYEAHDLDTNDTWIRSNTSGSSGFRDYLARWTKISKNEISRVRPPRNVHWWLDDADQIVTLHARTIRERQCFLALDENMLGYFYCD